MADDAIDTLAAFFAWTDAGLGRRKVRAAGSGETVELRLLCDILEVDDPVSGRGVFFERALELEALHGADAVGRILARLGILGEAEVGMAAETRDPAAPARVDDDASGLVGAARALGLFSKSLYLAAPAGGKGDLCARPMRDLVGREQLREAVAIERREGRAVGEVVAEIALRAQKDALLAAAGESVHVDLDGAPPAADMVQHIPSSVASGSLAIPLRLEGETLVVAVRDPLDFTLIDTLEKVAGRAVRTVAADQNALFRALERLYGDRDLRDAGGAMGPSEDELRAIEAEADEGADDDEHGGNGRRPSGADSGPLLLDELREEDEEPLPDGLDLGGAQSRNPGERALNLLLLQAAEERSEQVLLEPLEEGYRVRFRRAGRLREAGRLDAAPARAAIERALDLAEVEPARRSRPATGSMPLSIAGEAIEVAVATAPSALGTALSLTLADAQFRLLSIDAYALVPGDAAMLRGLLALPPGLVLVAAPPGQGKTTLLYALLRDMDRTRECVLSAERTIRARVEGAVQVASDDAGPMAAMASRLAPERVVVDDLLGGKGPLARRDDVRLALDLALTGARVVAAVDAPDPMAALARLVGTGIDPRALVAPLRALVTLRVVQRTCPRCREEVEADDEVARALDLGDAPGARRLSVGIGCWECGGTGYRGRSALTEVVVVDEALREALASLHGARARAVLAERGHRSLKDKALLALRSGLTTAGQVERIVTG